ncbi:unnamed protein product [Rhodiola kirilowii]
MDPRQEEATMVVDESKKSCAMCGTSKTPLWRSGPAGPKSLCNACGIKHRKRKVLMCKNPEKKKSTIINPAAAIPSTSTETSSKSKPRLEKSSSTNLQQSVKVGLAAFGKDMALLQRQRSLRRQRSEEEEAAVLLMSLSCGSVFA